MSTGWTVGLIIGWIVIVSLILIFFKGVKDET